MSTFNPKKTGRGLSTDIIHGETADSTGFRSLGVPVYRGSSTFFASTKQQQAPVDPLGLDYSYGLHGNPTQYTLAGRLASIEGAKHALVCPSGLNAITLVAHALLKPGSHWLIPDNVYGPVVGLAHSMKAWGVEYSTYDSTRAESLIDQLQPNTQLVWLEAPGSLTFETPDLAAIIAACKKHPNQPITGIDNTYSAGMAFKPFDNGIDISVQALTKYQSGHADVLMGAVLAVDTATFAKVERVNRLWGVGVSPTDCEHVLRGLNTLPLRYEAQAKAGFEIAQWLQKQPNVLCVLHPLLPECPGHSHFKKYFAQAAGLFSFVLKPNASNDDAANLVDSLQTFKIAYSWGGPESLATVVGIPPVRKQQLAERLGFTKVSDIGPAIRLAIGLEDVTDLKEDLRQALDAIE